MMINDMIHHHGNTMEIESFILLIRWQRHGAGGERDKLGDTHRNVNKNRKKGSKKTYRIWEERE